MSKIKIVPKAFLRRGKLGQQNSLYQDTTRHLCESSFSETIYYKLKNKNTLPPQKKQKKKNQQQQKTKKQTKKPHTHTKTPATLNCACSSGHIQSLHQNEFRSQILKTSANRS